MALRIRQNLERVRQEIEADPRKGKDLAKLGIKAIFSGKGTTDWENLMKQFVPEGSRELERLCGDDDTFNSTEWGEHCLAYIAGDATCTSETARKGGTLRSMNEAPDRLMVALLDAEGSDLQSVNVQARANLIASKGSNDQTENSGEKDSSDTDSSNDKS